MPRVPEQPETPLHPASMPTDDPSPLRVALFTDTLGDVNGVSRFIRNIADQALARGCRLDAITSTRFECPPRPNIHNLAPRCARAMPGYPQLELVLPDRRGLGRLADRLQPDVVHISTPGPVGLAGRNWALRRGLPLVGTYHTDFPAYIDHLFHEPVYTWLCARAMRWFYRPFDRIFTRSDDYARALVGLGCPRERIVRLLPGIDTDTFHARHRDPSGAIWSSCPGVRASSLKVLYVGRISIEKNLPLLAGFWPPLAAGAAARGIDTQLLIVGDGPYRPQMAAELSARCGMDSACFLGFRHGPELSAIYASSDLFVFPSTTDTLGQVVMEAQSAGLPVLVTDQGGPKEVVDDGVTGLVLPASDHARWIDAVMRLLLDTELRRRMGAAAHARIQPMSISHSFSHFWEVHAACRSSTALPRERQSRGG